MTTTPLYGLVLAPENQLNINEKSNSSCLLLL